LRSASTVRCASAVETIKQISFCEDDCEINKTFARTSAVVENVLPKTSGNPTIPGPPTLMSVTSRMAVSALTPPPMLRPSGVIFVPSRSGEKLLRIHTGIAACTTGFSVFGCSTFAPKYASSAASRYEITGIVRASATNRGSAVSTPSTSVQMITSSASIAAPRIVAE